MDNEEDLSCIIIEDDASEENIRDSLNKNNFGLIDVSVLSSPTSNDGLNRNETLDGGNESFNYLDELQTGFYMGDFLDRLSPQNKNTPPVIPIEGAETPEPELTNLSPYNAELVTKKDNYIISTDSSVVDLTTPEKGHKQVLKEKRPETLEEEYTISKRNKIMIEFENTDSCPDDMTNNHNLSFSDSFIGNFLGSPISTREAITLVETERVDSVEVVSLKECLSVDSPIPNLPKTLPKTLSLDALLSKWDSNFCEDTTINELLEPVEDTISTPILTPKSQARQDKKNRRQEIQLEKTLLRQKDRQIATLNKQAIDATQAWQGATLLMAPQWSTDTKIGQPLIALCEKDGAKVIEDPRMSIPYSIGWELKTLKRYDEVQAMFLPLPGPVYIPVRKILLRWEAHELLEWCLSEKGLHAPDSLDATKFDLQILRLSYPNHQVIAVVSGTQTLFRSIRTHINRDFGSQVRALDGDIGSSERASRGSSRVRYELCHIDYFEDFLIQLQLLHEVNIVQLETSAEITDFIHAMTKEISSIPHRPQESREFLNMPELSTRKSDSLEETWRLILEQIYLVTPTTALAVATAFPSFSALFSALQVCTSEHQKLSLLSEIEVTPPKGRPRRLGGSLAARILKTFTSRDPSLPIS